MSNRPMKMSELKLHRINQHIVRLREDLVRPRARVSEASASIIRYVMTTKDPLLPAVWGGLSKHEDPFYQPGSEGCNCTIS